MPIYTQPRQTDNNVKPPASRAACNRELGMQIEDKQWHRMCLLTKTVSSNARFKLTHFNFLHRTYITSKTLKKIDPTKEARSPRCSQGETIFLHLAWSCWEVQLYWLEFKKRITATAGMYCPEEPPICLLGDIKRRKGKKDGIQIPAAPPGTGSMNSSHNMDGTER